MSIENYFINSNYKCNQTLETIDTITNEYWFDNRIKRMFYTKYNLFISIKKLIKKENIKSILDIGCGIASKLNLLYPLCKEIFGIDQLSIIKKNRILYSNITFLTDDFENSILNINKKFDLIICSGVIEHLLNPNKLLYYIKTFSHVNSFVIITTPERDIIRGINSNFSINPNHIREWNKLEFNRYINSNDYNILYHKIIENYKFSYVLKRFRMFSNINELYHCQIVICNNKLRYGVINKIFKNKLQFYLKKFIIICMFKIRLILKKILFRD